MFEFLKDVDHIFLNKSETEVEFTDMEYDSRKIKENSIFIALEGYFSDGHDFIEKAIENGAKCIIVSKHVKTRQDISYILIKNLKEKLPIIASNFYNWPQKKLKLIGITGTNGKTTSTYIIEKILGEENVGRIGTIEYRIGDKLFEANNTTPECVDLIKICKLANEKKLEYIVMEVSSHALDLHRVDMFDFDVVLFTNLSRDHLDHHKTMENYFLSKKKIFSMIKPNGFKVINVDDDHGAKLFSEYGGISFGQKSNNLSGKILDLTNGTETVELNIKGEKRILKTNLLGEFNVYNILGSIGVGLALGIDLDEILKKVSEVKGVPGRCELIQCGQDFIAVVDYSHTEDSLKNIIESMNNIKKNRVITVFGCGGDRDPTKRPAMGKIATSLSDFAIVTSDNPRTEDMDAIISDILPGIETDNYIIESDREKAIQKAVEMAEKDDIIIVAGKGHETYQIIGREKIHFDDGEILRREIVLKKRGATL